MARWITPSAPKYDGAPFGNAPKIRIQSRNGKNPKEPGAYVGCDITGEGPRFGGPETNGLDDWDDPEDRKAKREAEGVLHTDKFGTGWILPPGSKILKPRQPGKLVHRLRRPDGSSVDTRLVAKVAERVVITDRHPDADLPTSTLVNLPDGPQFKTVSIFKIETRQIDNAPPSKDSFARFDRVSRGKGKPKIVLVPEAVLKTYRTAPPTETTKAKPQVRHDAAFVDLDADRKAAVRIERAAADKAMSIKLIRADITRQLETATGPRRTALLAMLMEG